MDKATVIGLFVGIGGILLGHWLEGGHTGSLMQLTAGVIVLTGTMGAVFISNPTRDLKKGFQLLKQAFAEGDDYETNKVILEIVDCTRIARKESVLALENQMGKIEDPFFKRILRNIVDGIDPQIIREIFESELDAEEEKLLSAAKIWSDAGGFSPTIGIIGAVLGLIHVMGNLTDTSKLGAGIAVAFVATVYGVSLANLVFLPIGNKIKKRVQEQMRIRRMILEGALMVSTQLSASIVDQKLRSSLVL